MHTEEELNNILQQVASRVEEAFGNTLDRIVLYGSYARGDNEHDSDLDIMVFLNAPSPQDYQYRTMLSRISSDIGLMTDLVISFAVCSTKDFEERKDWYPFFKNIELDGRKLYERV